ncbi:hypothetical protein B0H14DRAFT_2581944 [Mycena olivaceomarginata]|nr:hypothetical protein B0H14DRAFT_2581944 [Mycena olivaceomarginata]
MLHSGSESNYCSFPQSSSVSDVQLIFYVMVEQIIFNLIIGDQGNVPMLIAVSQDEESMRRTRRSAQPIAAAPPPPQPAPTGRASSSRPESQGFAALSGSQPVGRRTDSHRPETTTSGQPLFPVQNPQQTRRTVYYFCFSIAIEQLLMTF